MMRTNPKRYKELLNPFSFPDIEIIHVENKSFTAASIGAGKAYNDHPLRLK